MSESARVVVIHGSYGSPEVNWLPWLASEVKKLGVDVAVPAFPSPTNQNLTNWRNAFSEQVGEVTSNMVFVGHSLGPGFILNLLEESSVVVKGTFLVAGFLGRLGLEEFDPINESFVCRDFDWDRIRQNAGQTHVYNSDNDPYVPIEKGYELAEKLDVNLKVIGGAGHINTDAGYTSFPMLLDDISELLSDRD